METAQALLRPMGRALSEDDCSVDQSSRDNNSPSDSAFHSDFSFISIQDLGNSLSGNISFPCSSKTPIGWADDRSSRPLTTATFRLLAFRQQPTFYSVREQTRRCRRPHDLLSTNDAPESDEYSLLANDELSSDSDAYRGRRRCLHPVPLSFDALRLMPETESGLSPSAAILSVVNKTRQAATATEVDDAAARAARDVGRSPSRDSCENLTLFGDDEDSVASELLWSPSSSHNPPPSRPDFVPQLDLSWVVEDERSVGKRRSRKPTAVQSQPNERLDDNSAECKIDAKPLAPAVNSRDVEKFCFGSLRSKESNRRREEVNCGIQTNRIISLSQQNDNHHHQQQQQHLCCSEDGAVEKELFRCLDDHRNFVEEPAVDRQRNKTEVVGETSPRHLTSSESSRERAFKSFSTRSLEVQAMADRVAQNQCSESNESAFPSVNIQKSVSLSVVDAVQQQFPIDETLWTKEIASIDDYSRESARDNSPNSCNEKTFAYDYVRHGRRSVNASSKPATLYYADENLQQQTGPATRSCADSRTHAATDPEHSGTNVDSPYDDAAAAGPEAYFGGNRFYDVEAAVERRHNQAKQLSFCNFTLYCLCCRTNCRCNYSCCRWSGSAEDQ